MWRTARVVVALLVGSMGVVGVTAGPAQAVPASCVGEHVGETFPAGLSVPAGQWCELVNSTVTGSVVVTPGGALTMHHTSVMGSVSAQGATLQVLDASTVSGNVSAVAPVEFALGENVFLIRVVVCNSTVGASVIVRDSPQVGDLYIGGFCEGVNTIGGSVSLTNNRSHGLHVEDNKIAGQLSCIGNVPAPTGFNNTAGVKTGQCAGL